MRNVNACFNDYHVVSYENGNVVSCYRDTLIEENVVSNYKECACNVHDYGPQYIVNDKQDADSYCEHTIEAASGALDNTLWKSRNRNTEYYNPGDVNNHTVKPSDDEGYICTKCLKWFPSRIYTAVVYHPGDFTNDVYNAFIPNPELVNSGFNHEYADPDFYDTYGGLLDEVKDDNGLDSTDYLMPKTGYKVIYTTENTDESYDELHFWKRMLWLMTYSPKGALEFCKKHSTSEFLDIETKEWIWEIIKEDNKPLFKYAQFLMSKAKKIIKSFEYSIPKPKMEWEVKVFQPQNKYWGFILMVNETNKKAVIKQITSKVEKYFAKKECSLEFAIDTENRKIALEQFKANVSDIGLEVIGDSSFTNYISKL